MTTCQKHSAAAEVLAPQELNDGGVIMRFKKALLFLFCLISGTVLGSLLGSVCSDIPSLSWLAFSRTIGISPEAPFLMDLGIVRFSVGFQVNISVAHVIMLGVFVAVYNLILRATKNLWNNQ